MVTKDFEELFACFNARGVRAVIVGGYALAFHAKPRFTKDIDVFVEPTPDNANHLVRALEDFGFIGLGLTSNDFSTAGPIVQLGVAPNRVEVFFLGLEDLKRNKRASGRIQDLADLESL